MRLGIISRFSRLSYEGFHTRNLPQISKYSSQPENRKNRADDSTIVKKTPKGRLDETVVDEERHRDAEKEPLPRWPKEENPHTGEKGGPAGPEPTRFGDWERKGRVTDF